MATDAEIQAFVSQPGVTDAQIAAAMQEHGVSPQRLAAAVGASAADVQARYDAAVAANQGYQDLVTQSYADLGRTGFGEETSQIDQPGYDYWLGQLQSGAITPEQFRDTFGSAAAQYAQQNPDSPYTQYVSDFLIDKAYQDVFGREADPTGAQYWQQQLASGKISPFEFDQYVAKGATGLQDRLRAQEYLGQDYFAPEEFLTRTGGIGYQDVVAYVAQNLDDPTKIYQRAQEFNVNPEDVYAALQSQKLESLAPLTSIQKYFTQGQEGFENRFDQILDETFGNEEERKRLEKILGMEEGALANIYDPSQFSRSSLETIEETLTTGQINKIQDALIAKALGRDVFGYTDEEMKTVVSDLISGKEDDLIMNEVFDALRSGNRLTKDEYEEIMMKAAKEAPDSKIFKEKPELLQLYTPLPGVVTKTSDTKWGGGSGQYGYYNGAPILNAEVANSIVGQHGSTRNLNAGGVNYSDIAKTLGFDFAAHEQTTAFRAGNSVFGIDFDRDYLQDLERLERGEILGNFDPDTGKIQFSERVVNPKYGSVDLEGNPEPQYVYRPVDALAVPESSRFGGTQMPTTLAEAQQKLNTAAEKLGIDPTGKDLETLFDEVTDRSTGFYQIMGQSAGIQPEANPKGRNHVAAMYRQVGDKLVPVDLNFFHADAPKKKSFGPFGGFVGEMLTDVASIPGIAEIAAVATGMNPATYAALKAVQTYGLGGDLEDVLKSAGMAYVGRSILPGALGDASNAATDYLIDAGINPDVAGILADAGVQAASNAGMAAIQGADIGDAVERSLMTFGLNRGLSAGLQLTDFPPQFQAEVARMLSDAVVKGNVDQAIQNALMRFGTSQLKNASRNQPVGGDLQAARGGYIRRPVKAPRRVAPIRRDVRKLIPLRRSGLSYI